MAVESRQAQRKMSREVYKPDGTSQYLPQHTPAMLPFHALEGTTQRHASSSQYNPFGSTPTSKHSQSSKAPPPNGGYLVDPLFRTEVDDRWRSFIWHDRLTRWVRFIIWFKVSAFSLPPCVRCLPVVISPMHNHLFSSFRPCTEFLWLLGKAR